MNLQAIDIKENYHINNSGVFEYIPYRNPIKKFDSDVTLHFASSLWGILKNKKGYFYV